MTINTTSTDQHAFTTNTEFMMNIQQIDQPPQYSVLQAPAPNQVLYPAPPFQELLPFNQQQPQIIVVQAPLTQQAQTKAQRLRKSYKWRNSHIAGVCHILLGILCIGFGGGAIGVNSWAYFIGHGIWGGAMAIVAGAFAIWASNNRSYCTIVTHLVFAIIALLLAISAMGLAMTGAIDDGKEWTFLKERTAMNAVLAGLFIMEIGVCAWSLVICNVLCSNSEENSESCGCYGCDECYGNQDETTAIQYVNSPIQQLHIPPTAAGAAAEPYNGTAAPINTQSVSLHGNAQEGVQFKIVY
ncbi:hypothetical protein CAPTEDRAFT_189877 [Capitella teleta]|uniref:Uncharacterized protein n=1 Tax=Capitella teleta TaxID=283909 RepID=R7T6K1_CAPTE|nr:hypothetical protein CAPTEDRAFT_189877 [Capitella teleta]|eukprot:ELT89199.1 hypothetical protein CAPTEDRAFT_189877 [Capitella teleta]